MAAAAESTVSLKLLIDTKSQRVLYAEEGKEFVDFLFNMLLLPVATVTRLLANEGMVDCLSNLYDSVENLSETYILPTSNKDAILKPKVSIHVANVPLLLPTIQAPTTASFYRCLNTCYSTCRAYFTNDPTSICPTCGRVMNVLATFVDPPNKVSSSTAAIDGGYVKGVVAYTIMDDLSVTPLSTISSIAMLNKFDVKEVGALKEKVVNVRMNECVELLKASLQSKTVLTDVFLAQKPTRKPSK